MTDESLWGRKKINKKKKINETVNFSSVIDVVLTMCVCVCVCVRACVCACVRVRVRARPSLVHFYTECISCASRPMWLIVIHSLLLVPVEGWDAAQILTVCLPVFSQHGRGGLSRLCFIIIVIFDRKWINWDFRNGWLAVFLHQGAVFYCELVFFFFFKLWFLKSLPMCSAHFQGECFQTVSVYRLINRRCRPSRNQSINNGAANCLEWPDVSGTLSSTNLMLRQNVILKVKKKRSHALVWRCSSKFQLLWHQIAI